MMYDVMPARSAKARRYSKPDNGEPIKRECAAEFEERFGVRWDDRYANWISPASTTKYADERAEQLRKLQIAASAYRDVVERTKIYVPKQGELPILGACRDEAMRIHDEILMHQHVRPLLQKLGKLDLEKRKTRSFSKRHWIARNAMQL